MNVSSLSGARDPLSGPVLECRPETGRLRLLPLAGSDSKNGPYWLPAWLSVSRGWISQWLTGVPPLLPTNHRVITAHFATDLSRNCSDLHRFIFSLRIRSACIRGSNCASSQSLCLWARSFTHTASDGCQWVLVGGGKEPFAAGWLPGFIHSALYGAAVAPHEAHHHQWVMEVWINIGCWIELWKKHKSLSFDPMLTLKIALKTEKTAKWDFTFFFSICLQFVLLNA